MQKRMSFAADIRPLFTEIDVAHMMNHFDLSNHGDVTANADAIYASVKAGRMPPGRQWTDEMCATFKEWQDQGCPP